jgi:peroxiredoxin Q/BCP
MIRPGEKLDTSFSLKVVQAVVAREVVFRDLLTRPVIVSVYMKNNTPSCDRQNDSLVAHAAEFDRLGYHLVALSRDTCGSHLKYAAKKAVGYTLASDPADAFARAAGSIVQKSMYGKTYLGPARAAFVIARDGTVLAVIEKVDTADHSGQIRAVLAAL